MPTNKVNFPHNLLTSTDIQSLMKLKFEIDAQEI